VLHGIGWAVTDVSVPSSGDNVSKK